MEEEWIKYKELMEVNELVTQEETLKEEKKIWEEILKNENFEYKFKIEEITKDKEFSRYKGTLRKLYVLNLYIKEKDIKKVNEFFDELNKKEAKKCELEEKERIRINEEYENLLPRKIGKWFITLLMILLIILETIIIINNLKNMIVEDTTNIVMGILIIIEIYKIFRVWKRKK